MSYRTSSTEEGSSIRLTGTRADLHRIAAELGPIEFCVRLDEGALYLKPLGSLPAVISTEWRTYDFAALIVAAARLRFGILCPVQLQRIENCSIEWPDHRAEITLSKILKVAAERDQIRKALLAYAAGSAVGLFNAYEAVCHEIMNCGLPDYAAGVGTKEWLVQQGWIAEDEDDRFLRTVLYFRQDDGRALAFQPLSPDEAESFVRKVLIRLIDHLSALSQPPVI